VPSIDELELKQGNVDFSKRGVLVNKNLQSISNPNVYACGDVSASEGLPLTPLASQEARVVTANIMDLERPHEYDYPPQPSVVFTLPNVASVGLSEKQAKEKGYDFRVKMNDASDWFNSKRINDKVYAYKTLVDNETNLVLGAHLVSNEASETINMFVMAMCGKLDCATLKGMIFTYPSWSSDIKSMI